MLLHQLKQDFKARGVSLETLVKEKYKFLLPKIKNLAQNSTTLSWALGELLNAIQFMDSKFILNLPNPEKGFDCQNYIKEIMFCFYRQDSLSMKTEKQSTLL